jgi:hypothetical protein
LTDIATCQKRNVCKSWKSVACANVMWKPKVIFKGDLIFQADKKWEIDL